MNMQDKMGTTTFAGFIKAHSVSIPLIQRDYVQGRCYSDLSWEEKRVGFVEKLLDALLPDGKPCTLDFVYGARDSFGVDVKNDKVESGAPFLPLDGQQRLTTLFLLHWCILQKTKPEESEAPEAFLEYRSRMNCLGKFSYQTRISSGRFCSKLVSSEFKSANLFSQIRKKYWYDKDMQLDPTVQAMMQMVSLMEELLDNGKYSPYLPQMLEGLYVREAITFDILDMDKYNLTDGLYVKMNSRGKELTAFENWKADFISLLSDDEQDKERFELRIEHEWQDVFWKDAYRDYVAQKEEEGSASYPRIDERFMCFFNNYSRLLYFVHTESKDPQADEYVSGSLKFLSQIYKKRDLRHELFQALDILSNINRERGVAAFLDELFCGVSSVEAGPTSKVRLFLEEEGPNLFDGMCRSADFKNWHILLYALVLYCGEYGISPSDNMRNFLRICRNYLENHNYLETAGVKITPQIRVNEMKKYNQSFIILLSQPNPFDVLSALPSHADAYLQEEGRKVRYYQNDRVLPLVRKIEDMDYTHGNLKAFYSQLDKCLDGDDCQIVWEAIHAFELASPLEKSKLFVYFGYRGLDIKACAYGRAVFLGGEFEGARWMVHFRRSVPANAPHPLDNWVVSYVNAYKEFGSVKNILGSIRYDTPLSVKDYFLKYPDILASQCPWRKDRDSAPMYFAMRNPWANLDMITIHSFSGAPLNRAYQICPMVNAVCRKLMEFQSLYDAQRLGCTGQGATKSGIVFNVNGDWSKIFFYISFGKMEWVVDSDSYKVLPDALKERFDLRPSQDGDMYVLKKSGDDLVEDGVSFLSAAIEYFKKQGLLP